MPVATTTASAPAPSLVRGTLATAPPLTRAVIVQNGRQRTLIDQLGRQRTLIDQSD
jgi:hypothetical protein